MTIIKPPMNKPQPADPIGDMIARAPDGAAARAQAKPLTARKRTMKGNKEQISLTISVELVDKLDALALKVGQTRAALINMAIYQLLDRGVTLQP